MVFLARLCVCWILQEKKFLSLANQNKLSSINWEKREFSFAHLTCIARLMPPLSFFLNAMLGGVLLSRIPNPSSSLSMILLCCSGFSTSRTMKMRLHVRATAITWRPRPFPSFAPSIIPGRSSIYIHTYTGRFVWKDVKMRKRIHTYLYFGSLVPNDPRHCCKCRELVGCNFRVNPCQIGQ